MKQEGESVSGLESGRASRNSTPSLAAAFPPPYGGVMNSA